jgi:nicotinate-nucleotide pyrophosphorylase (carboxylating)
MTRRLPLAPSTLRSLVNLALTEDLGRGDITTRALFPKAVPAEAVITAKQAGVVAGLPVARAVFQQVDRRLKFRALVKEGERIKSGTVLAAIRGDGRSILAGERVALNFLQRLSGIATLTAQFVDAVKSARVAILDTRKTTPGLRLLEKYAVRIGGGRNHRFGLYDAILIKDNHLALHGSLADAVRRARSRAPRRRGVEVEAATLAEVEAAVRAGADAILLDNMSLDQLRKAVRLAGGRVFLEASGGVTLANVRDVASTGVDAISIGALTHSAPALDLSLELTPC